MNLKRELIIFEPYPYTKMIPSFTDTRMNREAKEKVNI